MKDFITIDIWITFEYISLISSKLSLS
jgi:hypothetical protein